MLKKDMFSTKICALLLVAHIVGFIFVSILPTLFGYYEESFTIVYRAFILFLSLMVLSLTFFKQTSIKIKSGYRLFLLFWLFYSIRIIYDLLYKGINMNIDKSISDYLIYAFGVSLIPSLAIIFMNHKDLNYDWVLNWIYRILFISLVLAILIRSSSYVTGRSMAGIGIGVLLYGQFGTSLCLLSLYKLQKNSLSKNSVIHIMGFIIGFATIIISASRSPFLALLVVIIFFIIFKYNAIKSAIILSFMAFILYIFLSDILEFLDYIFNSAFLERLNYGLEQGGDSSRTILYKTSLNEFLDNPFFGNAILIQDARFAGSYPHNLIIEAFMSTGFFGGLVFLAWSIKCLVLSSKSIIRNYKNSWVGLLFLQYFIFAMFSSNLIYSYLFWTFSLLVVALFPYQKGLV